MTEREHRLYQEILSANVPVGNLIDVFEEVLRKREIVLQEQQDYAIPEEWRGTNEDQKRRYARVIQALFENAGDGTVLDAINLAHKEELARRIWVLLHGDDLDFGRVEQLLADFCTLPVGESQISENIAIGIRVYLINHLISENLAFIGVAKNYINMRDIHELLQRFVGRTGSNSRIGGKSAGVILANRIARPTLGEATGLEEAVEEVRSFFVTSQVFSRFIEHNGLEDVHGLKYLDHEEIGRREPGIRRRFFDGAFPEDIRRRFEEILTEESDAPLIVRSSSLLEDSAGSPFYGKYDSVFVANAGSLSERMEELATAVKLVYVSIFSLTAIAYRRDRKLLDYKDMMCVLVQRVVGERYGDYHLPEVAGVALSRNPYPWTPSIRPEDGLVRLVWGLGTHAVERRDHDYPRLFSLSRPDLRPEGTAAEMRRYSQRSIDVLDLTEKRIRPLSVEEAATEIGDRRRELVERALAVVDEDRLRPLSALEDPADVDAVITLDGYITDEKLSQTLRNVLRRLQDAYGTPVEIEFAYHHEKLYILQCRALTESAGHGRPVAIPPPSEGQPILFSTNREVFRSIELHDLEFVLYVDGPAYHDLDSEGSKRHVGRLVGILNRKLRGHRFLIVGPGRWGTSNPSLGVSAAYHDINNCHVLVELADSSAGTTPALSYGTHFFQDLIAADIIPVALYPEEAGSFFDREMATGSPDVAAEWLDTVTAEERALLGTVCRVVSADRIKNGARFHLYLDASSGRGVCALK